MSAQRWRRFIWQGALLAVIGLIAAGIGDGPLGLVIVILGALLLLAGLIGGAVATDRNVGADSYGHRRE